MPGLARGPLAFHAHLAGAGVNLARHEERHDAGDDALPGDIAAHEVIVMAAVGVADEIGVVLVEADFAAGLGQLLVPAPGALLEDALAGLVLGDELAQRRAFWRRVFGVGVIVVKAGAVREDEVALDLLEGERAVFVDLVVGGLVGVLHQLRGAEAARVLVRVLEVVVPFHQRAVLGVTAHDLDGFVDDVDGVLAIDGDAVFGFDSEDALHGKENSKFEIRNSKEWMEATDPRLTEGVPKFGVSIWIGNNCSKKTAGLRFDLRSCGFSRVARSDFLCAFAPLREANPFWKRDSRKGAKTQSCPEGSASTLAALSARNRFFRSFTL